MRVWALGLVLALAGCHTTIELPDGHKIRTDNPTFGWTLIDHEPDKTSVMVCNNGSTMNLVAMLGFIPRTAEAIMGRKVDPDPDSAMKVENATTCEQALRALYGDVDEEETLGSD